MIYASTENENRVLEFVDDDDDDDDDDGDDDDDDDNDSSVATTRTRVSRMRDVRLKV